MINKLDLSGEWLLCLDKECKGTDLVFDDTINLPNTTSTLKKANTILREKQAFLQTHINLRALHGSEKTLTSLLCNVKILNFILKEQE